MTINGRHGFTLVEFVIAIVFIGVVLGPMLLFTARIHDLNSAVGQQARRESWRSFADQAVAAGMDPTLTAALGHTANVAVPKVVPPAVVTRPITLQAGLPTLVPLRTVADPLIAESRIGGSGFQLGAGAQVASRSSPAAPLLPVFMPAPVVTPADGSVVDFTALTPATNGLPALLGVKATSSAGALVRAALNLPSGNFSGFGVAQFTVTAVDLLSGVRGVAWTEYPGDSAAGDRAVALSDGRIRWVVTTVERRTQIYEPSAPVRFGYQIDLGAPVLVQGGIENATGATVPIDYANYLAIRSGVSILRLDFPSAAKTAVGTAWSAQSIGFQWTFQGVAGPFSGDLKPFFTPDSLPLWSDATVVSATPVMPAGAVVRPGTWTLARSKLTLGVPVLTTAADRSGFYSSGALQFSAPAGPDGSPLGRLSFEAGATLSTGPTLSMNLLP